MLTACWLAPIVLNIWSYLCLPDVYYLVAVTNLTRVRFTLTRINDLARPHTPYFALELTTWLGRTPLILL